VAFIAELAISLVLMAAVLFVSNDSNLARYTPYVVGALVATYLSLEAPLSGMSMNLREHSGPHFFPLLAWALDLFHRTNDGHADRR
jgi:glycerol uptake facilitator-like aquaporin